MQNLINLIFQSVRKRNQLYDIDNIIKVIMNIKNYI